MRLRLSRLARALALLALATPVLSAQRTVGAEPVSKASSLGAGPVAPGDGSLRIAFDEAATAQAERVRDEAASSLEDQSDLGGADGKLATAVEVALLLTLLSLLPAALITMTCFTRIVIVLSFVRRALSVNELPPNPVIIGLALFLTMFVMAPVGEKLYHETWAPYQAGDLSIADAGESAWQTVGTFLVAQTRKDELALFTELSGDVQASETLTADESPVFASTEAPVSTLSVDAIPPMRILVPAFILSELKTAFQMGFLLFLPFLVIDLVVSSVLLSMGMMMLPPVMISTPIKVLVFVLVDGWRLVCESLVTSFQAVSG